MKCDEKAKQVEGQQTEIKAVKGTMKSHKVVGVGNGREVSCYYPECLTEDICKNWTQESKKKADEHPEELMMATPNENTVHVVSRTDQNVKYQTNDFVAARYDYKPYIGKIVAAMNMNSSMKIYHGKEYVTVSVTSKTRLYLD